MSQRTTRAVVQGSSLHGRDTQAMSLFDRQKEISSRVSHNENGSPNQPDLACFSVLPSSPVTS